MNEDLVIRRALWTSVPFNFGGALLFAFQMSPPAALIGLSLPAPLIYRVPLALFVALFGGAYAWLARQKIIDQPLVCFAAIGKSTVFTALLVLWLAGEAPGLGVVTALGDAVLATIFFRWLLLARGTGTDLAGPMKTPPQADPNRHLRPMISPPPFPKASHTGRRVGSADKADCIALSVAQSIE